MTFVLDASAALSWKFADEFYPASHALIDRVAAEGAIVPALWRLEVANVFQVAVRRGRLDAAARNLALDDLAAMRIALDDETNAHTWSQTLHLSDAYGLTLYDAAYLELAIRLAIPLATLDRALVGAARSAGVETLL